ncbi:ATP phosphoribosyltransferase regulatory subunit [Thermatribacter velox]|uniref:ATP phosphoribosyltransferase regulatory subunit n=1 Tax=Thermatribacter velox TaxID=3039681 RepID=A0ABZ2YAV9_9BACT
MELVFGMKDFYPREVKLKRRIEHELRSLFESWGYEEIEPPTIEYYATLEKALGGDLKERTYKFINRSGELVCLRPEFTTSVARMLCSRSRDPHLSFRVYYDGKIFRYPSSSFRTESELTQIGLENIGTNSPQDDAEVIALALFSLKRAGITDFEVDIGHAGFFKVLLKKLGLSPPEESLVKQLLKKRDFVALKALLGEMLFAGASLRDFFVELPFLRGRWELIKEVENRFAEEEEILKIVERIKEVLTVLEDYGLSERVFLNLGVIRDFDYYTGIVFEGFSPQAGHPLLAGGRYDELFSVFGKNAPACGFALFVERLMEVIEESSFTSRASHLVFEVCFSSRVRKAIFGVAERLREQGISLVLQEWPEKHCRVSWQDQSVEFPESAIAELEEFIKREFGTWKS